VAFAQLEASHQGRAGCGRVLGAADDGDHLVQVVEGGDEALEDVRSRLGLGQIVGGAARHHFASELDEVLQRVPEREQQGPPRHQRQHVHPEGGLERRELVELVEDHISRRFPLQLDHHPNPRPIRLVAQIADAVDPPLPHQLGDPLDQGRLVHHVGDLGDDDALAPPALFEIRSGADGDLATSGLVGDADALAAADQPAGREIGPRQLLEQIVDAALRIAGHHAERIDQLAQVMGGNVGGHADGDSLGAVGEQIGKLRW
jgi:hypothetical protein